MDTASRSRRRTLRLSLPGTEIEADHGPLHEARCLTALALFGHDDGEPSL